MKKLSPELKGLMAFISRYKIQNLDNNRFGQRISYWTSILKESVSAFDKEKLASIFGKLLAIKDWASDHDALTGLLNRRGFDEALDRRIAEANRQTMPLSLILADIDDLKGWNDQDKSHRQGDLAITTTAVAFKKAVRKEDLVTRTGGDEFAVILLNATEKQASKIGQRVINFLDKAPAIGRKKAKISFGVSQYKKGDGIEDLYKRADKACYVAKEKKRV